MKKPTICKSDLKAISVMGLIGLIFSMMLFYS